MGDRCKDSGEWRVASDPSQEALWVNECRAGSRKAKSREQTLGAKGQMLVTGRGSEDWRSGLGGTRCAAISMTHDSMIFTNCQ
jgi:hypothetical protein